MEVVLSDGGVRSLRTSQSLTVFANLALEEWLYTHTDLTVLQERPPSVSGRGWDTCHCTIDPLSE